MHNLKIRLVGSGGGLVYAPLGPTHLAFEDISLMRTIPNMTIVSPCDAEEMKRLMPQTLDWEGPMYIRLGKGFVYLTAIVDWYSRYVIAWRLSNTLTDDFCVECLQDALQYGRPEIFNTDQGSQFTSEAFTKVLLDSKIAISMDGRGRCLDNIFVERLWRTVKYQNVYIKGYQNIPEAQAGLHEYFDFYNMERRHQALSYKTPWGVFSGLEKIEVKGAPVRTV